MGHRGNRLVDDETGFAETQTCYANLGRWSYAVWVGANRLANRDKAGDTAADAFPDHSLDTLCVP